MVAIDLLDMAELRLTLALPGITRQWGQEHGRTITLRDIVFPPSHTLTIPPLILRR
jgi:hypothetical protein